jgi:exopolysaccharide production protein ExoZ
MARLKTIQSLQAGRGLAALAVVLHHSDTAAHDFGKGHLHVALLHNGYLGVDFFFVLSGFIIYHSTAGRGRTAAEYTWARFRRVYLPYLPVGVGIALLYVLFPGVSDANRAWSWLPTLTLLPVSSATALSVAWTLKHEILFYAVFGVLYFTGTLWPGLVIWALLIASATMAGVKDFVPLAVINLEFLMGISVAVLYRAGRGHYALLLAAIAPFSFWIFLGSRPDWSVLVGVAFAFVILPVTRLEHDGHLKIPRSLTFLGAASYSIYLVHAPAISAIARLFRGQSYGLIVISMAVAGLAAGLLYFFIVERTALRIAPGDRRRQRLTGEEGPPSGATLSSQAPISAPIINTSADASES